MSGSVLCESHDGVAWLTVSRPEALNAINREVLVALRTHLENVQEDAGVGCVVIQGAGHKAFVAGADIALMKTMTLEQALEFSSFGVKAFDLVEQLSIPTIASVDGYALGGGCELALACDFIYASDKAKFGQPEIDLGLIPGFAGTQRLARRVGVARAKELLYSGRTIDAEEALSIGLANKIIDQEKLHKTVRDLALMIAAKPRAALRRLKRAIVEGASIADLSAAIAIETKLFAECFGTEDAREGISAFLEKRSPTFRHR